MSRFNVSLISNPDPGWLNSSETQQASWSLPRLRWTVALAAIVLSVSALTFSSSRLTPTAQAAGDSPVGSSAEQAPTPKSQWESYAVDYLYYAGRLAELGKFYEMTATDPSRLQQPAMHRLLDRKFQEEAEIRAALLGLTAPAGPDADALQRDTTKLLGYIDTLHNVASSRVNGTAGVSPRPAVDAYANFSNDLGDNLRRLRNLSQLDLTLSSVSSLAAGASQDAAAQWRQYLDAYSSLVNRLTDAANFYAGAAWDPSRMQSPEARSVMSDEATARASLTTLAMPSSADGRRSGTAELQQTTNRMLGALDELRTAASGGGGGQGAATKFAAFSAAANAALDRIRSLSDAR